MPKLLMVTTVAGTFSFLHAFAAHFRRLGWTVDALTGPIESHDAFPWRESFDRVWTAPWSRNALDLRNLAAGPERVRRVIADGRYDIVHVHTPVAAFVTRFALRRRVHGSPRVVYTAHGFHFHPAGHAAKNAAFIALEKLAGRWTDFLVVMNREDAAAAKRLGLVPPDRIRLMPGVGVDLHDYSPDRVSPAAVRALRAELGIGDSPCFLMVAEFIPRKRHADLLDAFATIAAEDRLPRAHLLLAGDGPLFATIRAQTERRGLQGRVHLLGVRKDVPTLMRASTALVLPSAQEGLPRCVLEAMALGLPAIGTRIRGTTELLTDGGGFLYDLGNTAQLTEILRRALLERDVLATVAETALQRVARYDVRNVIRLHEALYAESLPQPEAFCSASVGNT
jgi:glycosyltransferase involved in cell wall biosynthesis